MTPDWAARPTTVPYAVFGDPQSLNLYTYVRNNPQSKTDPDGHDGITFALELTDPLIECPVCEGLLWGGALAFDAYAIYKLSQHGKGNFRETEFENMTDAEVSAIAHNPKDPRQRKARHHQKGKCGDKEMRKCGTDGAATIFK